MKYCTNCGNKLNGNPKFCPSCGHQLSQESKETGPVMHKRQSKSLADGFKSTSEDVETSAHEYYDEITTKRKIIKRTPSPNTPSTSSSDKTNKGLNLWVKVYLIINILLGFSPYSDEKMGLLMFSIVVLLFAVLRRNNEKPINIWAKIILGVQIVFTISLIGMGFEDDFWPVNILYVVAILFAEVMVMWKGNQ